MSDIHSVDVEDDQFAYRYDTQLLIDRRDEDLDEDVIADYITEHFEGNCLIAAGDEDLIKIHSILMSLGRYLSIAVLSGRYTILLLRI